MSPSTAPPAQLRRHAGLRVTAPRSPVLERLVQRPHATAEVVRSCGTIRDADRLVGNRPCVSSEDNRGFLIDEAEVLFGGTDADRLAGLDDAPGAWSAPLDRPQPGQHIHRPMEV